ncbi:glycoside hydrolase family protein [Paraburkholderia saeva]|uniref:hypothetical protein n=1 Tax=Paraburkholderia saeva TaxID=2777537 RepID=UPI001E3CFB39|nr:hypothetical protein [Paraburkholderia saeva]
MGPTPIAINDDVIRVFVSCLDDHGRARPGYVDVAASDPTRVLDRSEEPLLDIGVPGAFDDNGLMATCVCNGPLGQLYLYYAGFELCKHIRYRIFTGLAISDDGGRTFRRHSYVPVLDRSDKELYFRCGPFVMFDEGVYKLWYIAGNEWETVEGKLVPRYDLRYQESLDGINWKAEGVVSLALENPDEHGFGRPWVIKHSSQEYELYYSIRRRSCAAYRLGYARSRDGVKWTRMDEEMGLDVEPGQFDSTAMEYSAVVTVKDKTWCFYNGDNFGEGGFGVAELIG